MSQSSEGGGPPQYSIALPIADRPRALAFYRDAFGLEPVGPLAEDGVPEPLMLRLGEGALLVLIPADGLDYVLGERPLAPSGVSECLLGTDVADEAQVDLLVERVRELGGTVLDEPVRKPWGYTAICADPDGHAWQITAGQPAEG